MPRYALTTQEHKRPLFLAAYYERQGNGIRFTDKAEDACSYVTIEKAVQVAQELKISLGYLPHIVEVDY
jgi:hypothetical protein